MESRLEQLLLRFPRFCEPSRSHPIPVAAQMSQQETQNECYGQYLQWTQQLGLLPDIPVLPDVSGS